MKPAMPAFFMMEFEIGYWGLFITSFLAATFIPITSELFLISMLIMGYHPLSCLFFAIVGNSLGGWFNYLFGQIGDPKWLKKIRVSTDQIKRWQTIVNKYGHWLGVLSWLPFIGDIMAVALGFFRVPWLPSFFFIFIGKFLRYLVIVGIFYLGWV